MDDKEIIHKIWFKLSILYFDIDDLSIDKDFIKKEIDEILKLIEKEKSE